MHAGSVAPPGPVERDGDFGVGGGPRGAVRRAEAEGVEDAGGVNPLDRGVDDAAVVAKAPVSLEVLVEHHPLGGAKEPLDAQRLKRPGLHLRRGGR
eukprot:1187286-Prorocentrum_minimum.AAC.1